MSRSRTPTAILDARGAFDKNPNRRRDGEPECRDPLGSVPEHFDELQRAAWNQLASECALGVLTRADTVAMEQAAILLAQMRADPNGLSVDRHRLLAHFLGRFGMTPSDRAKLSIPKAKDDANPYAALRH